MPKVSVLMTVYNGETHMEDAIESIRQQTMDEWELVVVDDGSQDKSASLVESFSARDPRIKLIRVKHVGRVRALNLGLEHCSGHLIAINDADDVSLPQRLRKQEALMRSRPAVAVLGSWVHLIDPEGKRTGRVCPRLNPKFLLPLGNPFVHSSVMYRKSSLLSVGGFDEGLPQCEDFRAITLCALEAEIAILPKLLVEYRVHDRRHFHTSQSLKEGRRITAKIALEAARRLRSPLLPLSWLMTIAASRGGSSRGILPLLKNLRDGFLGTRTPR